jgi:hypothetical protein
MTSRQDAMASKSGSSHFGDVVEIGLLIPANWAESLILLSKHRQQSVGQLLRGLIDQALREAALTP